MNHLILKENDAQRATQRLFLQRMVVVPGRTAAAAQELRHPAVGAHARPHRGHFHGQVVDVLRPQARDRLHLGRAFHLEDAYGPAGSQIPVDGRVRDVDAAQIKVGARAFPHQGYGLLHLGKSPQGQQVNLDEAGVVHAVLVPLADHASFDGRRLHRHHIGQRDGGNHHAARMLGHALGEAAQLAGEGGQFPPARLLQLVPVARQGGQFVGQTADPGFCDLGQPSDLFRRQVQRAAQIPDDPPRLVGGEHAGQGCVFPAPLLNQTQDQLLPDVARKVQIDVRRTGHVLRHEAFQGQVVGQRIHMGQAD